MPTSDRIRASRANGAKSHGPKTEAGKRRSSMNAVRHGLLAKYVVLENESQEQFTELLKDHLVKLAPADNVELVCVEEMVAATWRLRRLMAIETNIMDQAIAKRTETDELSRSSAAFSQLSAGHELHLIDRYENRLQRTYQRSLHNLLILKELNSPEDPAESELESVAAPESEPVHRAEKPVRPNEPEPQPSGSHSVPAPDTSEPREQPAQDKAPEMERVIGIKKSRSVLVIEEMNAWMPRDLARPDVARSRLAMSSSISG